MQPAVIRLEEREGVAIVVTAGELDLTVAAALAERIAAVHEGPVVVSLSDCTYIDSTILTVLIKATKARGGRLPIVLPVSHRLRRIFEIASVDEIVALCGTLDEAIVAANEG